MDAKQQPAHSQMHNQPDLSEATTSQEQLVQYNDLIFSNKNDSNLLRRTIAQPKRAKPENILALQRSLGNRAVMRILGKTKTSPVAVAVRTEPAQVQRSPENTVMRITVDFMETAKNADTLIEHIMPPKHEWRRLVDLSGDDKTDYKAIQPFLQEAIDNGVARNAASANPMGQPTIYLHEFEGSRTKTGNPEKVQVSGILLKTGVFRMGDAWVVTK